jgi:two-component system chemotaxis sensor kinase CheA
MERADSETDEAKLLVVVMGSGQICTATIVDELLAEQEITIKQLGRRIRHVRHVSGGTLLPSGETALVLNAANVIRTQLSAESAAPIVASETKQKDDAPRRLLVVDDSVTTRALMQAILESAGFNVQTAADGRFAMEKLDQGRFDLVVTDVDMPRLNGFGLTEAIRKSDRLAQTPVILVTARGTDEDKARGIQAGADGYIVKEDFEGNSLVETIQQLL